MKNQTKSTLIFSEVNKQKFILKPECNKSLFFFLMFIFIYLLVLNYLLIPISDDLYHVTAGNTQLKDCVERYMTFTSRFFEMVLVLLIPRISSIAFDIINSIIGTFFIYLFVYLIIGDKPKNFFDNCLLLIVLCMFINHTAFGADFLWTAGSMNYLWSHLCLIIFWIPYRLYLFNNIDCFYQRKVLCLLWYLLVFISGWSSELGGIISLFISFVIYIFVFFTDEDKRKNIPLWYYIGIVFLALGWFVLYFAPGTAQKALDAEIPTLSDILFMSIRDKYRLVSKKFIFFNRRMFIIYFVCCIVANSLKQILLEKRRTIKVLLIPLLIIEILITFYIEFRFAVGSLSSLVILPIMVINILCHSHCEDQRNDILKINAFCLFIYILCVLCTLQINIQDRTLITANMFLIAGIVISIYYYHKYVGKFYKYIILTIYFVLSLSFMLIACYKYNSNWKRLEQYVLYEKEHNNYNIIIENDEIFHSFHPSLVNWMDPSDDIELGHNQYYAKYFGVETFKVLKK